MGWTYSVIWFVFVSVSVCECWLLPYSDSVMYGEIQSPLYPQPYPTGLKSEWNLFGPEGSQIQLSITHLDIKPSAGCSQDSLTVVYDQKILWTFCGQENSTDHPGKEPIRSPGNKLTLIFQTSNSTSEVQQHIGFTATYKSTVIDCGKPEPLLNGGMTYLSEFQNQYRSVVQYRCNEPFYSLPEDANAEFTCGADGKWKSSHDSVVTPTCIPVCGQPTQHLSVYQRIIGGNDAPDDTLPWQVLLKESYASGGGMVIADRWIMTAAHMYHSQATNPASNNTIIYMGQTDVQSLMVSPVYAASVHIHPDYNNPVTFNNDIALIKLQDPITFSSSVMPICLPAQNATYVTGTMGLVSGFGVTQEKGRSPKQLKYVHLPVVDQETCSDSFTTSQQKRGGGQILTDNMICAGLPEGGKDSCGGDGGSAYALKDNGRFWAAGIVSWGARCGQQGSYGVYTRVANYLDWIMKTMQEN
ncbi:complement C1s subcomponent-like [Hippoglossus stenolepis]|uniref:complement C1s subcomponent-like n=1 Tax=Hippoglossus stenolepis TaxID=195615 RepID=UPI001FAFA8DD|nr:complement C1s subcomponent-like [Hippoglossus stenolepis]